MIKRNLLFLIAFILLATGFAFLLLYEGFTSSSVHSIFSIYVRFFYIFILVVFANERGSGFLAKQIANGLSRKSAFKYFQLQLFILAFIYYILVLVSFVIFCYILNQDYNNLYPILFSFLSFLCLGQLALLIVLFIRKATTAILGAYFLFLAIDNLAFTFIMKYADNQLYLLFPHGTAVNLVLLYNADEFSFSIIALTVFILVVGAGSFFKLLKSDLV